MVENLANVAIDIVDDVPYCCSVIVGGVPDPPVINMGDLG